MQMVLDALENECKRAWARAQTVRARDALRTELAKPEPVPVAWMDPACEDEELAFSFTAGVDRCIPLYRKEDL
jgi:hypothetical protein